MQHKIAYSKISGKYLIGLIHAENLRNESRLCIHLLCQKSLRIQMTEWEHWELDKPKEYTEEENKVPNWWNGLGLFHLLMGGQSGPGASVALVHSAEPFCLSTRHGKIYNWAQVWQQMVERTSLTNLHHELINKVLLGAKKCVPAKLLQKKQQEVEEQYSQLYMSTVSCLLLLDSVKSFTLEICSWLRFHANIGTQDWI